MKRIPFNNSIMTIWDEERNYFISNKSYFVTKWDWVSRDTKFQHKQMKIFVTCCAYHIHRDQNLNTTINIINAHVPPPSIRNDTSSNFLDGYFSSPIFHLCAFPYNCVISKLIIQCSLILILTSLVPLQLPLPMRKTMHHDKVSFLLLFFCLFLHNAKFHPTSARQKVRISVTQRDPMRLLCWKWKFHPHLCAPYGAHSHSQGDILFHRRIIRCRKDAWMTCGWNAIAPIIQKKFVR